MPRKHTIATPFGEPSLDLPFSIGEEQEWDTKELQPGPDRERKGTKLKRQLANATTVRDLKGILDQILEDM